MKKLVIIFSLFLFCSSAFADIIVTTSNQRIVCKIVHSDNKYVYYEINGKETQKISNSNIVSISISDNNEELTTSSDTNPQYISNEQPTDISATKKEKQSFNWHPSEELPHFQGKINVSPTISKNESNIYFGGETYIELGSRIRDFIYIGGGIGFEYQHLYMQDFMNSKINYLNYFSIPILLPIHFYIPVSEKIKPMFDLINGFSLIWENYQFTNDIYFSINSHTDIFVGYYLRLGTGIEVLNKHAITIGFKYDFSTYCGAYLNYSYSF